MTIRTAPPTFALALTALLSAACAPAPDDTTPEEAGPPTADALAAVRPPATYRGTLPCADCPGIRTTLALEADGTATLTRLYLNAEPGRDAAVDEVGRWGVDDTGRLTVRLTDGDPVYFAFARDGLAALDREGRPYASALPRMLERVPDPAGDPFTGTAWRFVDPGPAPGGEAAAEDRPAPEMRFIGNRLVATDGCDEFTGSWSVADGVLELRPVRTTGAACPEPAAARARAIGSAWDRTAGYRLEAGELVLLNADGAALARLRPAA